MGYDTTQRPLSRPRRLLMLKGQNFSQHVRLVVSLRVPRLRLAYDDETTLDIDGLHDWAAI